MIDCPKCHFRQPKDQYCASCGIDMIAFKPLPLSKSKTFFESGFFQIFILIFIATLVAYFMVQGDRPQNWVQKFSYYKKIKNSTDKHSSKSTVTNSTPPSANDERVDISVPETVNTHEFALSSEAHHLDSSLVQPPIEKQMPIEIKFIFAEVSRESLAAWISESQRLGLFQNDNDFAAGIILNSKSNLQIKFKDLKSEQKKYFIKNSQTILTGKTMPDTSEFMGFQTNLEVKSSENKIFKGHLNIIKFLRTEKLDLPLEFELPKGGLFFVNWKTALSGFENETSLFNTAPFEILQSPDFLNQKTEFVFLIELL